jgi:putative ABC transport system permease protein
LTDVVGRSLSRDRFSVVVLATFACLAMVVATVGLYGLIAYTVKQRTSEIGVRLALGAEPGGIERLVVKQCMQLVLMGLGLGMAGAILVTSGLGSLLYDVQPRDPMTLAVVALVQLLVGFAAGFLPARRAARVNPALVLRSD